MVTLQDQGEFVNTGFYKMVVIALRLIIEKKNAKGSHHVVSACFQQRVVNIDLALDSKKNVFSVIKTANIIKKIC